MAVEIYHQAVLDHHIESFLFPYDTELNDVSFKHNGERHCSRQRSLHKLPHLENKKAELQRHNWSPMPQRHDDHTRGPTGEDGLSNHSPKQAEITSQTLAIRLAAVHAQRQSSLRPLPMWIREGCTSQGW